MFIPHFASPAGNGRNKTAREETPSFVKATLPLATPDQNIRGQEGGDGRAKYD